MPPIAIVALVAKHESRTAQGLENAIYGGTREADLVGDLGYCRAVACVQYRQRIQAAHQRTYRTCGFHVTSAGESEILRIVPALVHLVVKG